VRLNVPADPLTVTAPTVMVVVFVAVTLVPPDVNVTALNETAPVLLKFTAPAVEPDVTVNPPLNVTAPPANVKTDPVDVIVTRPDGIAVVVLAMRNVPPDPLMSMVVAVIVVVLESVTFDPEDVKVTGPRTTAPVLLNVTVPVEAAEVVVRPARVTALFENVNEPPVYVLTPDETNANAPVSVINGHPEIFKDVIVVEPPRTTLPAATPPPENELKTAVSVVVGAAPGTLTVPLELSVQFDAVAHAVLVVPNQ
jgi:hypothetical protein